MQGCSATGNSIRMLRQAAAYVHILKAGLASRKLHHLQAHADGCMPKSHRQKDDIMRSVAVPCKERKMPQSHAGVRHRLWSPPYVARGGWLLCIYRAAPCALCTVGHRWAKTGRSLSAIGNSSLGPHKTHHTRYQMPAWSSLKWFMTEKPGSTEILRVTRKRKKSRSTSRKRQKTAARATARSTK